MYWLSKKDKIFKTNNEIREEIGFSERELKTAKTALKNVGFIKVSREGLPAKTYYEIDWDEYKNECSVCPKKENIIKDNYELAIY